MFEVYDGEPEEMIELKLKTKADFEQGLAAYFDRDFTTASAHFKAVLDVNANDKTARLYLERAATFMVQGAPEAWQGIEAVERK